MRLTHPSPATSSDQVAKKKKNLFTRVVQDRVDRSLNSARRKGEERLTIMIIPHFHEKVISLHLNWLMISFLTGTVFLAITLAGYGIYLQIESASEYSQMRALYGQNYDAVYQIRSNARQLEADRAQLMNNMERISGLLGFGDSGERGDSRADRKAAEDALIAEASRHPQMGPGTRFLPAVYRMRILRNTLRSQDFRLNAVAGGIQQGIGVFSYLPLGRPHDPSMEHRDTSGYGLRLNPTGGAGFEFHTGHDIAGKRGSPIFATGSGRVLKVTRAYGGYGHSVLIYHGFGFHTLYAHLSSIAVENGQMVRRGETVGAMGRTGRTTGTHLHYEIWIGEEIRIDPLPYICSLDTITPTCRNFKDPLL